MFPVEWGIRRQSLETWEKYSNEKLTSDCLWAVTCLWGKSQYTICMSSGSEMLWNWAFCGVFSPKISVYHTDITAEEMKALRLQHNHRICQYQTRRRGKTPVSTASCNVMLPYPLLLWGRYWSVPLVSFSPIVTLYCIYTVTGGNTLQICCCCWTPATEHLSISVIMQNAGQLIFVYILRGRECPHPSGQIRCNFRERKNLGSTVLAKTHEVCEREGIPKWWQGRPSVV